jgi:hypothetical protein
MQTTVFSQVYTKFKAKITDDMYMELSPIETDSLLKELLLNALHHFEFPRVDIYNYSENLEQFNIRLTAEEQNIIATYMVVEWLSQQLASVENTRMKYSGSDFKFTSQANHMAKLQSMKKEYERLGFHLQRLYKRRKADGAGIMRSTFGSIMDPIETSVRVEVDTDPDTPNCDCDDILADLDQNKDGIVDRANVSSEIEMLEF